MGIFVPVVDIPGNAGSATKLFNDSGTAPSYACRAWVNFNGSGTVAIRASGNVSSITDNGVGTFDINLTTSLQDANYAVIATHDQMLSALSCTRVYGQTTTKFSATTAQGGPAVVDPTNTMFAVFR